MWPMPRATTPAQADLRLVRVRANPTRVALLRMVRTPRAMPDQASAANRTPRVPAPTRRRRVPERAGRHQAGARANPARVALRGLARAPRALPGQVLAASRPPRVPARTKGHPMPERAGRHQAEARANPARAALLGLARAPRELPGQALAASRPPRVTARTKGDPMPERAGR